MFRRCISVYTRRGDFGTTGVLGDSQLRLSKSHPLYEAMGTLDELSSHLGCAYCAISPRRNSKQGSDMKELKLSICKYQMCLQDINAFLAKPPGDDPPTGRDTEHPWEEEVGAMEGWIDDKWGKMEPLSGFILPSGGRAACQLHISRAVCRRAERTVVGLAGRSPWSVESCRPAITFLNRLGDWLFTAARYQARLEDKAVLAKPRTN